jgi:hypothetical protein
VDSPSAEESGRPARVSFVWLDVPAFDPRSDVAADVASGVAARGAVGSGTVDRPVSMTGPVFGAVDVIDRSRLPSAMLDAGRAFTAGAGSAPALTTSEGVRPVSAASLAPFVRRAPWLSASLPLGVVPSGVLVAASLAPREPSASAV